MTTYVAITDAETDPSAPVTSELAKKWRDNPIAIAEGSNNAPINQAAWHPYNKVTVGDSNTGLIYNFATDGTVATVTSPDFTDNYEYAFLFDRVSADGFGTVRISLYRETSGAYAGSNTIDEMSVSTTSLQSAFIQLPLTRITKGYHSILAENLRNGTDSSGTEASLQDNANTTTGDITRSAVRHTTPQKILRAQFSLSSNNISGSGTGGKIYMYRRRVFS